VGDAWWVMAAVQVPSGPIVTAAARAAKGGRGGQNRGLAAARPARRGVHVVHLW